MIVDASAAVEYLLQSSLGQRVTALLADADVAAPELIDAEVRRIVDQCHRDADRLLAANREQLDALATALLEHESLDEEQILQATGLPPAPQPRYEPVAARAAAMTDIG